MDELEFRVDNSSLVAVKDIVINANFDECEAQLREMITPYATLVVTEDDLPTAKANLAKLRKVSKQINDYKIAIKKAYTAPADNFAERCKRQLLDVIDTGIANIDKQVKECERVRKDAKIAELREYFDSNISEYADFLTFETVFNPRWENNGYAVEDAKKDIIDAITKCAESVEAIRAIGNEFVPSLLVEYAKCHDLLAVMHTNQTLMQRKEAEERKKAEMIQAAEKEAVEREITRAEVKEQAPAQTVEVEMECANVVDFRVWATDKQLAELKAFLKARGIKYGRVE